MAYPSLQQVIDATRHVGDTVLMPCFRKVARRHKMDGSVVTEADLLTQNALKQVLQEVVPYPLLGEEMSFSEQREAWEQGGEGLWCVDPVDGTANFANGLEQFAISVAFLREGKPELGVIYAPALDEMFSATIGQGAMLNGRYRLIQEKDRMLSEALAEVDFKRLPKSLAVRLATQPPYHSQRNFGSAALSWCYLAAGRIDLSLHGDQSIWDYAAGSLILREAGGGMRTLESADFWSGNVWSKSPVAARTPGLLSAWADWITK
ncbi:MAG: inositol monophosphatase family protein [Methylophilaceae bacterium]|nr:inositol monophosphatase family protein [Methylophilaceae bacterium]